MGCQGPHTDGVQVKKRTQDQDTHSTHRGGGKQSRLGQLLSWGPPAAVGQQKLKQKQKLVPAIKLIPETRELEELGEAAK